MSIQVVEFFQNSQSAFFDFFFNLVSFLGEEYVYIVLIAIVYYAIDKKFGEYLSFSLFFTGITNGLLKNIIKAPRPFEKYPDRVTNLRPETSTGSSFPSGHTQMFTTFWSSVYIYLKKNWLLIIAIVFSIFMAISRMYLGVHFLEDVVVSILLGIIISVISFKLMQTSYLHKFYLGLVIITLPLIFIFPSEDIFKSYGILAGFVLAMYVEKKYINFKMESGIIKKSIRVLLGVGIMMVVRVGLSYLFDMFADEGTLIMNVLDSIRYFALSFVGLGLVPKLFKPLKI